MRLLRAAGLVGAEDADARAEELFDAMGRITRWAKRGHDFRVGLGDGFLSRDPASQVLDTN